MFSETIHTLREVVETFLMIQTKLWITKVWMEEPIASSVNTLALPRLFFHSKLLIK